MEKRKTTLTIEDFEDKKYGAGKRYTRFKTSEGWISSFDKEIIEKLKDLEGKSVSVEITTDDDDRDKITQFLGEAEATSDHHNPSESGAYPTGKSESLSNARKSVKGSAYEKDPVVLAVECLCVLREKMSGADESIMEGAISLVKQVQKAFE